MQMGSEPILIHFICVLMTKTLNDSCCIVTKRFPL